MAANIMEQEVLLIKGSSSIQSRAITKGIKWFQSGVVVLSRSPADQVLLGHLLAAAQSANTG